MLDPNNCLLDLLFALEEAGVTSMHVVDGIICLEGPPILPTELQAAINANVSELLRRLPKLRRERLTPRGLAAVMHLKQQQQPYRQYQQGDDDEP